jgi:hypothetical protein
MQFSFQWFGSFSQPSLAEALLSSYLTPIPPFLSGAENSFRTVRRVRRTRVAGRKDLAKPLPGKKVSENNPDSP